MHLIGRVKHEGSNKLIHKHKMYSYEIKSGMVFKVSNKSKLKQKKGFLYRAASSEFEARELFKEIILKIKSLKSIYYPYQEK